MPASAPVKITAAPTATGFLIRIEGWGTMRDSPVVDRFGAVCLEEKRGDLAVDLRDCDYLDSTFLGCLVGLQKRFNGEAAGSFRIVACEASRQRLLKPLRLDKVLTIGEEAAEPSGEWITLCSSEMDPPDLGRHVLACHRRLVELGGQNEAVFGPIVQRLAGELAAADRPDQGAE